MALPMACPGGHPDETINFDLEQANALLEEAGWLRADDGLRYKDGQPARFRLTYPASDTTRQQLAQISAEMVRPLGIEMQPTGRHWDEIQREALHQDAIVFGFGSHSPQEIYYLFHSEHAGFGFYNSGFYTNERVDQHLEAAQAAASAEEANPHWQAAQWDGSTGYGLQGDASWAWMVNLTHVYAADPCLNVGELGVAPMDTAGRLPPTCSSGAGRATSPLAAIEKPASGAGHAVRGQSRLQPDDALAHRPHRRLPGPADGP